MAIYRTAKKANYTPFDNSLIRNTYMSMKATMLLLKMLSMPKDWQFNIEWLITICKEGKTAIKSAIAELEQFGHLRRRQGRKINGQIEYVYDVYENPKDAPSLDEEECHEEPVKKPVVKKPQVKKQVTETLPKVVPQTENLSTVYYYKEKKKEEQNKKEQNNKICENVILHLNALTGSAYKPTSRANKELINRLLSEGFTENEIITVIDKKYAEWNGTDWAWCLRPSTLFGQKFEGYLNAPPRPKTLSRKAQYGACGIKIQTPPVNDPMMAFMSIH